jgi:hypothetical protein
MPLSESQKSALAILFTSKPSIRKIFLKHADKNLVCTICECVYNLLKGNIAVSNVLKKKLSKRKEVLRKIEERRKGPGKSIENCCKKVVTPC